VLCQSYLALHASEQHDLAAAEPQRFAAMQARAAARLAAEQRHPRAYGYDPLPVPAATDAPHPSPGWLETSYALRYQGDIEFGWHGARIDAFPASMDFRFRVREPGRYRLVGVLEWPQGGVPMQGGLTGQPPLAPVRSGAGIETLLGTFELLVGDYSFTWSFPEAPQREDARVWTLALRLVPLGDSPDPESTLSSHDLHQ
jgi:hypothetical protein